jgi:hypothetical protein
VDTPALWATLLMVGDLVTSHRSAKLKLSASYISIADMSTLTYKRDTSKNRWSLFQTHSAINPTDFSG